ncbi:protein da1-related 2 [Phtheirospermum japonicum]|uniref:Protein da1-related 2 n=1 Tax=Phtheirospermum japonicum TaxID=374723 RepID=A0A830BGD7_9LAMI|nr:protein da1-related 2 [Phtheirospermum japonicum]
MKWVSRLFKGGPGNNRRVTTGGPQPAQSFGDENTVWRAPVRSLDDRSRANKEKEELDRAIALSMAEDLKKPNGYKWRTDNEEDLARTVNDGFNSAPYPPYAPNDYYHRDYRLCGGCKQDIAYGNYLGCMGMFYHPECFRCRACRYPITEHECMESAIMDTGDCQPLYHSIRDFYEGMNMRINQQIPMLLVERHALNEAIEGEKHGFHHMPETRGLCLSEEQTVTSVNSSVLKRPRIERAGLVGIRTQPQKLIRKCEVTAILVLYGLPRLLTGAILAHELMHGWLRLNGYRNLAPEVEEGICQVLSHMWLDSEVLPETRHMPSTSSASRSMPSTSSSSSHWSSSKKGGRSSVENKLGEFFMHQIEHDASPAYGGGYRAAMSAVNKYGLRRTLDHIRYTGTFPE